MGVISCAHNDEFFITLQKHRLQSSQVGVTVIITKTATQQHLTAYSQIVDDVPFLVQNAEECGRREFRKACEFCEVAA